MKTRSQGVVLSYVNTVLNMVCGFLLSSFFVKVLGDTEYGLYQMVTSFAAYLVILEFGTSTAITRNLSRSRARNESKAEIQKNISTLWTISLILALIIVAVAVVFYAELGNIYKKLSDAQVAYAQKILAFEIVYLVISFLCNTMKGIVLGFEEYKALPVISIARTVCRTVLVIAIVLVAKYAIVIALVDAAISLVIFVFFFFYCIKKFNISFSVKWFDSGIFREAVPLCSAVLIQTIVNQANSNVDQFIIGIKLTPEQVSYYSIGLFYYSAFSTLTTVPVSMYGPQIIKDVTTKVDEKTLMAHLISPSRIITLIGSTVLCGFFVAGKQFINIFYGQNYNISWSVALIIMVPMLINMSNGVLINVLDALNKRMVRSYILLLTTILNVILTIVFIDIWGVIGACLATAISVILGQIILMNIYYAKKLKIKVLSLFYYSFKGIFINQIIASAIAFAVGIFISNKYLSFFAAGSCYVLIFAVLFFLFGMNKNEKNLLNSFLHRFFKTNNKETQE